MAGCEDDPTGVGSLGNFENPTADCRHFELPEPAFLLLLMTVLQDKTSDSMVSRCHTQILTCVAHTHTEGVLTHHCHL